MAKYFDKLFHLTQSIRRQGSRCISSFGSTNYSYTRSSRYQIKNRSVSNYAINNNNSVLGTFESCNWTCRKSYATDHKLKNSNELNNNNWINGVMYKQDTWTNITPKILSLINRNLHLQKDHPICLIKEVIIKHFYKKYVRSRQRPIFSVYDNLSPVVSTYQNFDSMLIPKDHISRRKSDNYYINSSTMLRAHTSAHEAELIRSGLDAFLVVGDCYRRDEIDTSHYPAFHQLEGVRLFSYHDVFENAEGDTSGLSLFEDGVEAADKQDCHTLEASKIVELALKQTLEDCMQNLFGKDIERRWVDAYFPFTHPSFELEVKYEGEWMEVLGCGVLRQDILNKAGANEKIGWAFGLGLERLAMKLFDIPDIRYFWSNNEVFLSQFRNKESIKDLKFKPYLSKHPALFNDISFWIPEQFHPSDFYDIVRTIGGDLVENVVLHDDFIHPKSGRRSHCYRLFYRHVSRTLSHDEVSEVQKEIREKLIEHWNVEGRW
uniref:phenylalanine--tRNA ligase, mitochondrial-like n=1 Tax=Styela clava TaxID=7725 RepID=UPI00193A6069|nr:phenylalanine--tRNA ligase, mitochondrial-like [Styela clava]